MHLTTVDLDSHNRMKNRIAELEKVMRPFHAAVFIDNGDVTIWTGHITHDDWLKLARVMRNQEME